VVHYWEGSSLFRVDLSVQDEPGYTMTFILQLQLSVIHHASMESVWRTTNAAAVKDLMETAVQSSVREIPRWSLKACVEG
jgi:hypothetical protein